MSSLQNWISSSLYCSEVDAISPLDIFFIKHLHRPPGTDQEVIVRSFYKLTTTAPDSAVESLVQTVNQMHPAWSSLLFYLWPRRHTLPLLQGRTLPPPRYAKLTWEDILMSGQGSNLVLHQLRQNYADFFIDGVPNQASV